MEVNRFYRYLQIVLPAILFLAARMLEKLLLGYCDRLQQSDVSQMHDWVAFLFECVILTGILLLVVKQDRARRRVFQRALVFAPAAGITLGLLAGFANRSLNLSDAIRASVPGFLLLCVVSPTSEEFVYRGFVLDRCRSTFSVPVSIGISSVLFAVPHKAGFPMAAAFLLGLILGAIAVKTNDVRPCCIAHAVANMVGWLFSIA